MCIRSEDRLIESKQRSDDVRRHRIAGRKGGSVKSAAKRRAARARWRAQGLRTFIKVLPLIAIEPRFQTDFALLRVLLNRLHRTRHQRVAAATDTEK